MIKEMVVEGFQLVMWFVLIWGVWGFLTTFPN